MKVAAVTCVTYPKHLKLRWSSIMNTVSCSHRLVFRCTAVDGFSGTLPSTNFQVHGLLSHDYDHKALTVGQWSCSAAPDLGNPAEARSVEHRIPGVAGV